MAEKSFGAKNIDVSNNLNVSGVGSFTTGLDLDGYLKDKDDGTGSNGQVLISAEDGGSQKVQWANLSVISSDSGGTGIGFIDLNDTPPNYTNQGGKLVAVNSSGNELEFVDNTSNTNTGLMPSGSIIAWGGKYSTIPSGYLFCDGSAYSRTTYSTLFAALGTIHGSGDGSTTFNIPNLKNKFIIGANTSETADTFPGIAAGKTGGSADAIVVSHNHEHTLSPSVSVSGGSHSHGISNDSHAHPITDKSHNHGGVVGKQRAENTEKTPQAIVDDDHTGENRQDNEAIFAAFTGIEGTNSASTNITINNSGNLEFTVTASMSGSISSQGSDGENANLPPYYALCYIIKT